MLIGIVLQQSALKIELNFLMITLIVKRRYKIKRINNWLIRQLPSKKKKLNNKDLDFKKNINK